MIVTTATLRLAAAAVGRHQTRDELAAERDVPAILEPEGRLLRECDPALRQRLISVSGLHSHKVAIEGCASVRCEHLNNLEQNGAKKLLDSS